MRLKSGVTMIELVVVVVIILLIISFSVFPSRETLTETQITKLYSEMLSIKSAVNAVALKYDMEPDFEIKQGVHYDSPFVAAVDVEYGENVLDNQEDWYIILGADQKELYDASVVKDTLGLDAIENTYIVDFKTSDVELYKPQRIGSKDLRTFEDVRNAAETGNV